MLGRIRTRLTYANIVSSIALVIAMTGGVAYAANTIYSTDIVDGEVKRADIATGAINAGKVQNGTLTGNDIATSTLTGIDVADSSLTGSDIADGSLTGSDIDESTLNGPLPRLVQDTASKVLLNGCGGCPIDMGLIDLAKGHWLASYTVTVVNFTGTSDLFRCWLTDFFGGPVLGLTTARVGPGADVSPFHGEAAITVDDPTGEFVRIRCSHDSAISATPVQIPNAYLEFATLSAVEVAA